METNTYFMRHFGNFQMNRQKKEIQKAQQRALLDITPIDAFSGKYRFLSNFYPAVVRVEDMFYTSVEHGYQCAKINDIEIKRMVSEIVRPGDVKVYVHQLLLDQPELKRSDWQDISLPTMEFFLCQKFQQNLFSKLLEDTGTRELVEGNTWHDNFYGDCRCGNKHGGHEDCLQAGENHLGRLLMQIRAANRKTLFA
jgi:ribA/ribD-fused uncharacterized protein